MTDVTMPTRWSYSSLSTYEDCPRKWKYGYIEKIEGKPSAAMARGSRLHQHCEDYLKGTIGVIPWELTKVARALDQLKGFGAKSEETWLVNSLWEPVEDPDQAWVKSIIDVHYLESSTVLQIIDFKSGREYPEHRDQLELYGIKGLKMFPKAKRAEYKALYLDTGHTSNEGAIIRDMLPHKIDKWARRAIKIWEDKEFKATPSKKACGWCDYNAKRGGLCYDGV